MGNPLQPMLQVSPAFNPTINVAAATPAVNMPPIEVSPASVNVEQAAITAPSPVIQVPESKPILQAPPVIKNIIQAVADSPIVKTFVKAVAAVPDVVVNPAAVNNVISLPKMGVPKVSPGIQAMVKTPSVTAMFDPLVQPARLPDINVPQAPQKETLVERIKEIVRPQERQAETAPINITFSPSIVINGNADRQEVEKATEVSVAKFRELFEQFQREQRRVQYG